MRNILDNFIKLANIIIEKIHEVKKLVETRENERTFYDHYRTKMEKLKDLQNSRSQKDQEKYTRNLSKFDTAKQKYDTLSTELNDKMSKVEDKIQRV